MGGVLASTTRRGLAPPARTSASTCEGTLTCLTWNVAAINNNPFEYWVTHDNEAYLKLMEAVQAYIDAPTAEQDVEVREVFTDEIFEELATAMAATGWTGVEETRQVWKADLSTRHIVSSFLKDKQIGAKRLASMPDRLTNTINLAGGGVACRPTVISNFEKPLPSIHSWWVQWRAFMFEDELDRPAKGGGMVKVRPYTLLSVIPRAKYPAITEKEEAISLPLQTLCCAIFDAILVHMLNTVAPDSWHSVKSALCGALSTNKVALTLRILEEQYADVDAIFLQECAASFTDAIAKSAALSERFHVLLPACLDTKRDQNSVVLVSCRRFSKDDVEELTADVSSRMSSAGSPPAAGDLYAAIVQPAAGAADQTPFLLASFHGDTDGLMTVPFLDAICSARVERPGARSRLVMGIDANAYCAGVAGKKLGAAEFAAACVERGFGECWSGHAGEAPLECCTTFNARTYLQPQLNKAVSRSSASADPNTDRNPKDYIIFDSAQLEPSAQPERDNMGVRGTFDPDAPFPTLHFPSDHAVLVSVLAPVGSASS